MATNKISLNIAGLNILVSTPEDEEYVTQIARELDDSINVILQSSSGASVTNAVLLCAIDYLDSYKKANRAANNMRSQIKEYLSEAANAKLECDEEKKRNDELGVEIQALRNHLTRIATEGDNSGVIKKLRDDYAMLGSELEKLRKKNTDLISQNKSLTEKNDAMSTYIAGQDREIARLSATSEELNTRLIDKTNLIAELSNRLSSYENQVSELMAETNRLRSELELLEQLIREEKTRRDKEEQRKQDAKKKDFVVNINDLYESKPSKHVKDEKPAAEQSPPVLDIAPAAAALPDTPPAAPVARGTSMADAVAELYGSVNSDVQTEQPKKENKRKPEHNVDADIEAAIQQVNEKAGRPSGRSMKDFDIDISGIPSFEKADAAAEPEALSDFGIDENEVIIGFASPQNQPLTDEDPTAEFDIQPPAAGDSGLNNDVPWDEPAAHTPAQPEPDPRDTAFIGEIIEARIDDEFTIPAPSLGNMPEPDDEPADDPADEPASPQPNGLDDDAMPNLSWTLDV